MLSLFTDNFLFDGLEDNVSGKTKRDTDHHYGHHYHHQYNAQQHGVFCCKGDHKFDPKALEHVREMKRECMKEIFGTETINFMDYNPFNCKQMTQLKSDLICVIECVARKAEILDEDGAFNEDVVRDLVKTRAEGVQWKMAVADKVVDKCLAETDSEENEGECSVAPIKLAHCIWTQFIQHCPVKLQNKSPVCKKIRNILSNREDKSNSNMAALHQAIEQLEEDSFRKLNF